MHANARLTPRGRLLLCQRVASGRPVAHVAAEMGVSRATGYKWVRRLRQEGTAGLLDRSSRPRSCPWRTAVEVEQQVLRLRRGRRLGPARIGGILQLAPSTVGRVLARHGEPRLSWLDRPTGQVIRRYERDRPGELVHVDVKKLGRLRDGGGWRMLGHDHPQARANHAARSAGRIIGHEFVHVAVDDHTVDDHSRLAYLEVLDDERAATAAGFWTRAAAWFTAHGITVERVLTDNGACYRSRDWATALTETGAAARRTRPYHPQSNGKVERFNRTMADEALYAATYTTNRHRRDALTAWLHTYNHHAPTPPSTDNPRSAASPSTTSRGTTPSRRRGGH